MHELVAAFADGGVPLHPTLVEMLDDHCHHRTVRRGCGYTQATRFFAGFVNNARAREGAHDASMFADAPVDALEALAARCLQRGWAHGWRRLDEAPDTIVSPESTHPAMAFALGLATMLAGVRARLRLPESVVLLDIVEQLIVDRCPSAPALTPMPEKPEIGSCTMAEEFFLEIAHGRVRRGGSVNVYADQGGRPLLVEKVNLGESHSAMSVNPVTLNGVWLPPGSLFALRPHADAPGVASRNGRRFGIEAVEQARFLRLTTLAVEPAVRARAFAHQLHAQKESGLFSPESTRIDQLREFAGAVAEPA